MLIPAVRGICPRVGRRKSLEGVGEPHPARAVSPGFEDRAHENARTSSPDTGFDQVAIDAVTKHALDAVLNVVETSQGQIRVRSR
jgi:hypothetical protein